MEVADEVRKILEAGCERDFVYGFVG